MSGRCDALLLLGVELGADNQPTPEMVARVDAAARMFARLCDRQGELPLIACGGRLPGHSRAEADAMAALLFERGVPEACVVREDASQDTMGNMRCAARLLGGAKGKRVLIVTSDYHLRRAVWTARRAGFHASGCAAPLAHDAAWRTLRRKEFCFTLDLLMGWQDEGRRRPGFVVELFDWAFGRNGRKKA